VRSKNFCRRNIREIFHVWRKKSYIAASIGNRETSVAPDVVHPNVPRSRMSSTEIGEGERENLPATEARSRAPFQHPGRPANRAAWQRTAGRGDARDWPVGAGGGRACAARKYTRRFALNVSVERRGARTLLQGRAACFPGLLTPARSR